MGDVDSQSSISPSHSEGDGEEDPGPLDGLRQAPAEAAAIADGLPADAEALVPLPASHMICKKPNYFVGGGWSYPRVFCVIFP